MFSFAWSELALTSVLDRLYSAAEGITVAPPDNHTRIISLLEALFDSVGGIPISDTQLNDTQLAELAIRLLDDACCHVIAKLRVNDMIPGFFEIKESALPFSMRIIAQGAVPINSISAGELELLPKIGKKLASRIIVDRRTKGLFLSLDELAQRISGIGPETIRELKNVLSFATPMEAIANHTTNLDERFAMITAIAHRSEDDDSVIAGLEFLCAICSKYPHPASVDRRRRIMPANLPSGVPVEWISPLIGSEYHKVIANLFNVTMNSIDVCMFHIALGGSIHPTSQLLQALVVAVQRGIAVRVLLDRDRPTDPYNSTVVNKRAIEFLETNGVPVKVDRDDELLHSKFVVLDNQTVVIGSHNWSIGSFFNFDDVSLIIESHTLAEQFTNRFNSLWQN